MPVLLREADFGTWLSGDAGPEVLQPAAEGALREWTVDRRVNRTGEGDDDPTIVEPLAKVG
jgi:putative SOS response-associated peptidase YedK